MPVIWGLDLKEIHYKKFASKNMFSKVYYLRSYEFIVYQAAMILCVCSESVGTAALSDYVDQQNYMNAAQPGSTIHNDNIIGIFSWNIFYGIYVATIFGAAFFFDLFWPERHESQSVKLAWKINAVITIVMGLAGAIAMTVIIATKSTHITGVSEEVAAALYAQFPHPQQAYKHYAKCIASLVLLWLGWLATIPSTYLLFTIQDHKDAVGPFTDASANAPLAKHVVVENDHDLGAAGLAAHGRFSNGGAGARSGRSSMGESVNAGVQQSHA